MFRSLVLFGLMTSLIAVGQKSAGTGSANAAGAAQSGAGTAGAAGAQTGTGGVAGTSATPGAVPVGSTPGTGMVTGTGQGAGSGAVPGAANTNQSVGAGATNGTNNTSGTGTGTATIPGVTTNDNTGASTVGNTPGSGLATGTGQGTATPAIPGATNTNQPVGTNNQVTGNTNSGNLNVNSGFVTNGSSATGGGGANGIVLAPPNVALPGSGPATGAPPDLSVNNARFGGTGSVVPGGAIPVPPFTPPPVAASGDVFHGVLNTGMGAFVGANGVTSPQANAATLTVADVARLYKERRGNTHPREYDNARLESLENSNARNNQTLTQPNTSEATPADNNTQNTQNTTAALDPRDLATVEAELARSRAAAGLGNSGVTTANIQPPNQGTEVAQAQSQSTAESATQPTTPRARQARTDTANTQAANNNANNNANGASRLPASASPLPLIALFGFLAAVVGVIVRARRA
jgi:hypothetical protein